MIFIVNPAIVYTDFVADLLSWRRPEEPSGFPVFSLTWRRGVKMMV
jgi:hypothetical protein